MKKWEKVEIIIFSGNKGLGKYIGYTVLCLYYNIIIHLHVGSRMIFSSLHIVVDDNSYIIFFGVLSHFMD